MSLLDRAKELVALAERTSPGPWRVDGTAVRNTRGQYIAYYSFENWEGLGVEEAADLCLVVAARNDAPSLARAVVELAEALRPFAIHDDISGENTLLAVSPADMRRVRAVLRKLEEK